MRTETKIKVAKRKQTVELLQWLYSRRDPTLRGSKLSLEHRRAQSQDTRVLTYGEVDVPDFLCILDIVKPSDGEVFVDLGSGVGKAVLAAACGFSEFSECRGIEIVKGLSDAASYHIGTLSALLARPSGCEEAVVEPAGTASGTTHAIEGNWRCPQGAKQEKLRARGLGTTRPSGSKAKKLADQGLGATDLEELIADLLAKKTSQDRTKIEHGNTPSRAFSMESIAAELVRTLGHRRYRASVRGYGGLQKFLARGDGQTSRRISVDQDSGKVALKLAEDLSGRVDMGSSGVRKDPRRDPSVGLFPNVCEAACVAQDSNSTESKNVSSCQRQRQKDEDDMYNTADGQAKGCHLREREASQAPRDDGRYSDDQQVKIDRQTRRDPDETDETDCMTRGKRIHPDPSEAGCLDHGALELLSASKSDLYTSDVAVSITPEARAPSPLDRSPRPIDDASALGRNKGLEKPEAEGMFAGRPPPPASGPVTSESLRRVKFVCGDFFEERCYPTCLARRVSTQARHAEVEHGSYPGAGDDADVVYMASLLFSDDMMARLRREISKLRNGARIISLKPIPLWDEPQSSTGLVMVNDQHGCGYPFPASSLSSLRLIYEGVFKMSWQMARVYMYLVQSG